MNSTFVSIENVANSILLEIGDEDNKRYYVKALQWTIDAYRDLTIGYSPFYLERKVTLDDTNYTGDYPDNAIKILSVGTYLNGSFHSFTKRPDMSLYPPDAEDEIYVDEPNNHNDITQQGYVFGFRGGNIGYWNDDPENRRFMVKNFRWNTTNGSYSDTTSDVVTKVVVRYKTSGINCGGDTCIPMEVRSLIIALVTYKFALKNIPVQVTVDGKDRMERQIETLQEKWETLMYEPHNFYEVKDAIYGSLNATARR